jgi:hypothetical protein
MQLIILGCGIYAVGSTLFLFLLLFIRCLSTISYLGHKITVENGDQINLFYFLFLGDQLVESTTLKKLTGPNLIKKFVHKLRIFVIS